MLTVGVNLSASPESTWVAAIDWHESRAELVELAKFVPDGVIVEWAMDADRVGIDCPLGWPANFVEFLRNHQACNDPAFPSGATYERNELAYRLTDFRVRELIPEVRPPSVAGSRLGLIAMRCAGLQWKLRGAGVEVDRAGITGSIVEVYPAASLSQWGLLPINGYKGSAKKVTLRALTAKLASPHPHYAHWLDLGPGQDDCAKYDHAFDAVIAALTARAAILGRASRPENDRELAIARTEGWIRVPEYGSLGQLGQDFLPR